MSTSHGNYEFWCKNLVFEEMGKCNVYDQEYSHEYESMLKAKAIYYWKTIKAIVYKKN